MLIFTKGLSGTLDVAAVCFADLMCAHKGRACVARDYAQ